MIADIPVAPAISIVVAGDYIPSPSPIIPITPSVSGVAFIPNDVTPVVVTPTVVSATPFVVDSDYGYGGFRNHRPWYHRGLLGSVGHSVSRLGRLF